MTATASAVRLTRRDPRVMWGGVVVVVVALAMLALALDVPYVGSFVDWLINRVPPLSYLIVQYAVPIAYGAMCGLLCERAGVVNVGIEGMILTSAFVAFLTGAYLHPVVGAPFAAIIAIVAAIVVAMLLSTLHAWLSITIKADQIISGTVINILALGGTAFFNQLLVSTTGLSGTNTLPRFDVPNEIAAIPLLGPIVDGLVNQGPIAMGLILAVIFLQVMLFRSRWGLRTRAVGEHPKAADTVGIDVYRTRYRSVILGGIFAGLAGAYLTLEQFNSFQDNMTGGVGFIGLAALIFGRYTPLGAYGAALLFGAVQSMQLAVRIRPPTGDLGAIISTIPPQIFGMLPYIFTIIVLAGVVGRTIAPAADGVPYDKEARG
ncbi:MAG TPA: ABC transporter permease [Methylomirabilota bacterium]|nr:ABC transporter permease [Methylomirabilota bacterium]